MEQANILEYIKSRVLPKLKSQEDKDLYTLLGNGFYKLGDTSLTLNHLELAGKYRKQLKELKSIDNKTKNSLETKIKFSFSFNNNEEKEKKELKLKKKTFYFTKEELTILSASSNWFIFLKNQMIEHFINNQMDLINKVSLRKKVNSMLSEDTSGVDVNVVKFLKQMEGKEEDKGVVHISSSIMPRWDLKEDKNKEEWRKYFEDTILRHLSLDGYSMQADPDQGLPVVEEVEKDD